MENVVLMRRKESHKPFRGPNPDRLKIIFKAVPSRLTVVTIKILLFIRGNAVFEHYC
jgi:hypothetical protein